jgi:hypothetical protein
MPVASMRRVFALGLALGIPGLVVAGDSEESLRHFLARSDVIVLGEFATEPVGKKASEEVRHYQADFKISQVVKWDAPGETRVGETIKVHILLDGEERLPELKKGGKCLLFLKCHNLKPNPSYITADFWFGVQRPNAGLASSLLRLVTEQNKTPLRVPAEKDIELFYPDPVRRGVHFKDFKIDRAALVKILREYHVIPKQDWKHNYSHVGLEDRTGTIFLRNGARIRYMVRPGGLAALTFLDGRRLYLAREK